MIPTEQQQPFLCERGSLSHGAVTAGRREYFPALDGLRAAAVMLVLLAHGSVRLWPEGMHYRGGTVGVQIFFVLSGFLITTLLLKERLGTGRISLGSFWARRALRIWPLYFAVLSLYAFVLPNLDERLFYWVYVSEGSPGYDAYRASLPPFFFFLQNYLVEAEDIRLGLGITWSLAIEEHFYLFWPLLVIALKPRHLPLAAASLLAASFALRALTLAGHLPAPNPVGWMTHTNLDGIALGSLVACLYALRRERVLAASRRTLLLGCIALAALGASFALGWPAVNLGLDPPLYALYSPTLVAVGTGALLVLAVGRQARSSATLRQLQSRGLTSRKKLRAARAAARGPLGRLLSSGPVVHVGRVSYGIYLLHPLVLGLTASSVQVATAAEPGAGPFAASLLWTAIFFAATVGLASLSYRYYEGPLLRLKGRFQKV